MASSLTPFLSRVRSTVFQGGTTQRITMVMGNSSADLDSIISSVVFSYFYTNGRSQPEHPIYVPILNLPSVASSELWRLRPECGTALRLAIRGGIDEMDQDERQAREKRLLEPLITIADLQASPSSRLHSVFTEPSRSQTTTSKPERKEQVVLVDHNAPSIPGFSPAELSARLDLVGVIDHHVEESAVPSSAHPRIVTTGIGSCTSLVVQHLQQETLWPSASEAEHAEMAKLALAPILIDTANLQATGDKISATDRDAVRFLESHILPSEPAWDRTAFYDAIQTAKSNSLDLLTMREIFARDYKAWTETPASSPAARLTIGIASLVHELSWLTAKAGSTSKLAAEMHAFARGTEHDELSLFALLTKGNAPDGDFRKELAVVAYGAVAGAALDAFEAEGREELKLREWREDEALLASVSKTMEKNGEKGGSIRVWWQGDVSKSRKQVAPLLREAVKKV